VTARERTATAALALILVAVLGILVRQLSGADDGDPSSTPPVAADPPTRGLQGTREVIRPAGPCAQPARGPFVPARIDLGSVASVAAVVGVPRTPDGVTGVLPVDEKSSIAWDLGGIEPGSRRGNVLLNAHTWPDGSALGNAMLRGLQVGDRLVVSGSGHHLCYLVSGRIEVLAADGYPPYYDVRGPPQLAIIVCSGQRIGPGQWTKRTIWFARPLSGG
jgi:hypothetical protein